MTFSDGVGSLKVTDSTGTGSGSDVGTNNLTWGILIDTENYGIPEIGGSPALVGSVGLNLTDGVDLGSNDLFFLGGQTFNTPFGPYAGPGSVGTNDFDPFSPGNGVDVGDPFYVVWFDLGIVENSELLPGTAYGLVEEATFLLPSSDATISYSPLFSATNDTRTAGFQLVPEPSFVVLLLMSCVPLLRRRR